MGREEIPWQVVSTGRHKDGHPYARLISDDVHFYIDYDGYWRSSELRKWLNGEYLDKTFSACEKESFGYSSTFLTERYNAECEIIYGQGGPEKVYNGDFSDIYAADIITIPDFRTYDEMDLGGRKASSGWILNALIFKEFTSYDWDGNPDGSYEEACVGYVYSDGKRTDYKTVGISGIRPMFEVILDSPYFQKSF